MTTDERLERLIARHEVLTGSVELLTADLRSLNASVEALSLNVRAVSAAQGKTQTMLAQVSEDLRTLANIAQMHHDRITRLEERAS